MDKSSEFTYESDTRKVLESLGRFIKVEPVLSGRSGEPVRNQYVLKYANGEALQSYDSLIGIETRGRYYFSERFNHSKTTRKYCNWWCGMDSRQIQSGLDSGEFCRLDTFKME